MKQVTCNKCQSQNYCPFANGDDTCVVRPVRWVVRINARAMSWLFSRNGHHALIDVDHDKTSRAGKADELTAHASKQIGL